MQASVEPRRSLPAVEVSRSRRVEPWSVHLPFRDSSSSPGSGFSALPARTQSGSESSDRDTTGKARERGDVDMGGLHRALGQGGEWAAGSWEELEE